MSTQPQASKSVQSVYTFADVYVVVDGRKCPVTNASLHLAENTIPTITIGIDPTHTLEQPTNVATVPTLAAIAGWHNWFVERSTKRTVCQFNATVLRLGKLDQKLALKDWILVGAGINSAGAAGTLALTLTLQHPICLCRDAVLTVPYVSYVTPALESAVASAATIKQALFNIMQALSTTTTSTQATLKSVTGSCAGGSSMTAQQAIEFLQRQLTKAKDVLQTNLTWNAGTSNGYSSWPLEKCLGSYLPALKYALVDYFDNGACNNIWDLIAGRITVDWMVAVMPVLNGPMQMRPFSPWLRSAMKLREEDITMLSFPGEDPNPILGVTTSDIYTVNDTSLYENGESDTDYMEASAGVTYAPSDALSGGSTDLRGTIVPMKSPPWLMSAQNHQAAADGSFNSAFAKQQNGQGTTAASVAQDFKVPSQSASSSSSTIWTEALFAYAKASFYAMYRQGVQVGIKTRLLIESPDGVTWGGQTLILPSNVCSVISGKSDVVFDFYVTSVIHSFDCGAGTAGTEIAGMYGRPPKGIPSMIKADTPNPLYVG